MNSNTAIVRQLKEIFPSMEEDFLSGLCEAYRGDEIDIDEMVDLILGFQYSGVDNQVGLNDFQNNTTQSLDHLVHNNDSFQHMSDEQYFSDVIENNMHNLDSEIDNNDIPYPEPIIFDSNTEAEQIIALPSVEVDAASIDNDILVGCAPTCEVLENVSDEYNQVNNVDVSIKNQNDKKHENCENQTVDSLEIKSTMNVSLDLKSESNKGIDEVESAELPIQVELDEEMSIESCIRCLWVENEIDKGAVKIEENVSLKTPVAKQGSIKKTFQEEAATTENENSKLSPKISDDCGISSKMMLQIPESSRDMSNTIQLCHQRRNSKVLSRRSFDSVSDDKSPSQVSSKKVSLRCCKVKHDDWRLKKLLRQNRLVSHKERKSLTTSPISPSQFDNEQSKLSLLSKVLSDADPEYLVEECRKISNQEELLMFISRSLDSHDYPKLEPEGAKTMEQFDCTIEEFLMAIPDPVKEFSNNYIRTGYEGNAEIYLKSRYQNLNLYLDVNNLLKTNNYNLTDVCQDLDARGMEASPYCLDGIQLHHSASVFFHQEVWYIEHRKEIDNLLESAIEAARVEVELNRPPTPPPVEEVFECEICMDEIEDYSQLGTCDGPSGHLFCKTCVKRSAEIKFAEGGTTFPCLVNCGGFIPLQIIQEVLSLQMYEKLMDNIQEAEILEANMPGTEYCPFCHFAIICPEGSVFCCDRPGCMKMSCRICWKEDHAPELCAFLKDEDEETARHIIENKMSEALVRQCYKCNKQFVKEIGCNKMTCPCGAIMCYICRQPVKDYTHFNGQGGDNHDRCELFSDETAVHDRPVAATAQQTFDQLMANNPGLNLDRDKIIPK